MNCGIYNQLLLDYYWITTGLLLVVRVASNFVRGNFVRLI